jgi:hypothetical protein
MFAVHCRNTNGSTSTYPCRPAEVVCTDRWLQHPVRTARVHTILTARTTHGRLRRTAVVTPETERTIDKLLTCGRELGGAERVRTRTRTRRAPAAVLHAHTPGMGGGSFRREENSRKVFRPRLPPRKSADEKPSAADERRWRTASAVGGRPQKHKFVFHTLCVSTTYSEAQSCRVRAQVVSAIGLRALGRAFGAEAVVFVPNFLQFNQRIQI